MIAYDLSFGLKEDTTDEQEEIMGNHLYSTLEGRTSMSVDDRGQAFPPGEYRKVTITGTFSSKDDYLAYVAQVNQGKVISSQIIPMMLPDTWCMTVSEHNEGLKVVAIEECAVPQTISVVSKHGGAGEYRLVRDRRPHGMPLWKCTTSETYIFSSIQLDHWFIADHWPSGWCISGPDGENPETGTTLLRSQHWTTFFRQPLEVNKYGWEYLDDGWKKAWFGDIDLQAQVDDQPMVTLTFHEGQPPSSWVKEGRMFMDFHPILFGKVLEDAEQ